MNLLYNGTNIIFITAIKKRISEKEFKNTLIEFKIPTIYIDALVDAYSTSKLDLEKAFTANNAEQASALSLTSLQWRTDVTISTTSLERVFKPNVLFQMILSDGSIKQFECNIEKFQELRFQTALVLRNMQGLKSHPTLVMNNTISN